jgi:hypothetical protein
MEVIMVNCHVDPNIEQKVPQVNLVGAIEPLEKKACLIKLRLPTKTQERFNIPLQNSHGIF